MSNPLETKRDIAKFCQDNDKGIETITDALDKLGYTPENGRQLLAFIIGMSLSVSNQPATDAIVLKAIARGWQATEMDKENPSSPLFGG